METRKLRDVLGYIDIYLLDQILKDRYTKGDTILDAGCGNGRNIHWLYENSFNVYGVDREEEAIKAIKKSYPKWSNQFEVAMLEQLPYAKGQFDHIICSAVLHFAEDQKHFENMFAELIRVLKSSGSLFIRMTSNIAIKQDTITPLGDGVCRLVDGSDRFLLTKELLYVIMETHDLSFIEPLKSTNVHDLRSMSTLVLKKN